MYLEILEINLNDYTSAIFEITTFILNYQLYTAFFCWSSVFFQILTFFRESASQNSQNKQEAGIHSSVKTQTFYRHRSQGNDALNLYFTGFFYCTSST